MTAIRRSMFYILVGVILVIAIWAGLFAYNDYKLASKEKEEPKEQSETNVREVSVGEWVEGEKLSPLDGRYHPVSFRITGVVRGDEAVERVERYNDTHNSSIGGISSEDLEYCVVEYEVQYPLDYPQQEGIGIEDPTLKFSIKEEKIRYSDTIHKGIKTVYDISEKPGIDEFYAGDCFTAGEGVFVMVKEYNGFKFKYTYTDIYNEKNTIYINFN